MKAPTIKSLTKIIREIRKFDCGAWLMTNSKGSSRRVELMKLLDKLYAEAGITPE